MSIPPSSATAFLELLDKSRLYSPDELQTLTDQLGLREAASGRKAAHALVRAGQLTRYQANRLLAGRYRGFFLDSYRLLDVLGTGGMGRLFLAEDGRTGRQVALKVLSDRFQDDAGMLARLQLEARAGSRLNHPHVVRTFELARSSDGFGRHYIVMEFVRGLGIEELVNRRGPCPWPQACDIIRQAAAGLQHAHDAGLVHRDVKPGNLLIDHEGTVKVADFGLALLRDKGDDEFSLNMIFGHDCVGSAEYMAPEQALDCRTVDARADLYGLGCTFYAILTASVPFPGHSGTAAMKAHCTQRPRPVRELVPDVPEPVAAVVERMMAKRPDERFAAAADVQQALEPHARPAPVDFDFPAVLAQRAEEARRRGRGEARRETKPRQNTTVVEVRVPSPSDVAAARLETDSRRTRRSGIWQDQSSKPPVDPGRAAAAPAAAQGPADRPAAAAVLPADAVLVPLQGGAPIPLVGQRLLVGRSSECDVRLPAGGVSGRHCELKFEGSWWRVTDLESKNGTRVNGAAIQDQMLWPGDVLTVAELYGFRVESHTGRNRRRRRLMPALVALAVLVLGTLGALLWLTAS